MCFSKSLLTIAGVALIGVLATASAHAFMSTRNVLTFSGPVALPGVTLPAGTYTFRNPSDHDKNVVQVLNQAETKSYYMGITTPVSRSRRGTDLLVTIGEAPAGQVRPIQVWFPRDEAVGHGFIYDR
jgi:hypothetical protein